MKRLLNFFAPLICATLFLACQACQGDNPDVPKNPEPGEFAAQSSKAMMTAKLNGSDWSADYLRIRQTKSENTGVISHLFEIHAKIGKDDNPARLPGIVLAINRRTGVEIGVEKFDLKALIDDPDVVVIVNFEQGSDPQYFQDKMIDETYGELEITSLSGNKIAGTWKMKLVNENRDFAEFIEGQFESDYYLFQSF